MGPYCCRRQSPQQHLPLPKAQVTQREEDPAPYKTESAEHVVNLPSTQMLHISIYTLLVRSTGLKCKLEIMNKDCTSFIDTLIHNSNKGNHHLNPKLVCKQTLNFLLNDFQKQISAYTHTQPFRVYGILLQEIIPCTELNPLHQFSILW